MCILLIIVALFVANVSRAFRNCRVQLSGYDVLYKCAYFNKFGNMQLTSSSRRKYFMTIYKTQFQEVKKLITANLEND